MRSASKVADKVFGLDTTYLPYNELVQKIKETILVGANQEQLARIEKTAKGGWKFNKTYTTDDGHYSLCVMPEYSIIFRYLPSMLGLKKDVYLYDTVDKKYYQIDNKKDWKKFYQAIQEEIKALA